MNTTINSNSTSCKVYKKIRQENPAALINKIVLDYSENGSIGEDWNPNYDNESLLCDIINGCSLYIDFKHGEPTTDQIFDAVYGKGVKCRLRVVMYDGERSREDKGNPTADEIIVESFINGMNSYGANIFLVKVGLDAGGCIEYDTKTAPDDIVDPSEAKIPPEDIVRENEFWDLYYWSLQECFFVAHRCLEGDFDDHWEYGHQYEMNDIYWSVKWDKSGIFYEIGSKSLETDNVKAIWKDIKYELQTLLSDYKNTYVTESRIPSRIRINAFNLPVKCLLNASMLFKKELAERILAEFAKLDQFMQNAAAKCKKDKLREVTELRPLAKAC